MAHRAQGEKMPADQISAAESVFHVEDTGGDLPPVLCLHSLFMDNRMFDRFTEDAEGRFRVIRPDFRGQGRSRAAVGNVITVEQCAGDIAAIMDTIEVSCAHVLATSMGGDVALRLAVYRPDLVRTLALLGTSARAEPDEQSQAFDEWVDDVVENGFTGERLDFVSNIMFGASSHADPALEPVISKWNQRMSELDANLAPAMRGIIGRHDANPLLSDIDIPTLVLSGEECPVRPPDWARELAEGISSAELVMLPRVGHSPILEARDVVVPRLLDFFSR
jgi:3-oxoadipate enol-lactonase